MKLDFAVFANHATYQANGLFNALDAGLEWVLCRSLPALCLDLSLLARFSFEPAECEQEYGCTVIVTAPSGNVLEPNLTVALKPKLHVRHPASAATALAHFRYSGFYFREAGFHRFSFLHGDVSLGEAVLEAVVEPVQ